MKKILFLTLLLLCIATCHAQDLTSVFLKLPTNFIPGLTAEMKDKLISKNDTGRVFVVNIFGDSLYRTTLSNDYVALQTSEKATLQIKLLPLVNDSKIICLVTTVCGKACDSQIRFYNTNWEEINNNDLIPTKNKAWFLRSEGDRDSQDYKNAMAALDMNPITFTLSDKDLTITAEYEIQKYLSTDSYEKIKPFILSQSKKFIWDKVRFR